MHIRQKPTAEVNHNSKSSFTKIQNNISALYNAITYKNNSTLY